MLNRAALRPPPDDTSAASPDSIASDKTMACAVRLFGISKSFGTERVVDNLNLELLTGELFALLGPSGCGKSTTLRMIAGLERPDQGRILCGDRVISSAEDGIFLPPRRRNMGMVFQSYAMWPHLDVFESVAYPLRIRRTDRKSIEARVAEALALVGLEGFAKRRTTELSGGQQQRVALARSLVYRPDVLLLDEPFSSLDLKLREQLRIELKLLQRQLGITVLLVTHDQTEALTLADRVAVMRNGVVEQIGDPRSIYETPESEFVRDFVGRSICLPARIKGVRDDGSATVSFLDVEATLEAHQMPFAARAAMAVNLSFRPEDIVVGVVGSPAEEPVPTTGDRSVTVGTVRAVLYGGDRTECVIDVAGREFEAFLDRNATVAEGQKVSLVMPWKAMRLWPERTDASG